MTAEPGTPADANVSVVIIENHALYRKGLRAQFETDSAIEVVAEFDNAVEGVREVLASRPSVVLMDLHLPWKSGARPTYCGAQAITEIRRHWPEVNVVVVTMFGGEERVHEALKAGAMSYVSKDGAPHEVIDAVRLAAQGLAVLNRGASEIVARILPNSMNGTTSFTELGPRENELVSLAAAGHTDRQIAERLNIAQKTVANYWTNIRNKLDVPTREAAVELARVNGFQLDEESTCGSGEPG
jgi:DNA-binding NarL/FixJ family response regulator